MLIATLHRAAPARCGASADSGGSWWPAMSYASGAREKSVIGCRTVGLDVALPSVAWSPTRQGFRRSIRLARPELNVQRCRSHAPPGNAIRRRVVGHRRPARGHVVRRGRCGLGGWRPGSQAFLASIGAQSGSAPTCRPSGRSKGNFPPACLLHPGGRGPPDCRERRLSQRDSGEDCDITVRTCPARSHRPVAQLV